MKDIDWFCEFYGYNLYRYQKIVLMMNKDFMKTIHNFRHCVEKSLDKRDEEIS